MPQLTSEGPQYVTTALAQRYGVSTDAVVPLLQALVHGHGTRAQCDHPDVGGRGQWRPGGMVMVGDMFNQARKATVDGLCVALASLLAAVRPRAGCAHPPSPRPGHDTPPQSRGVASIPAAGSQASGPPSPCFKRSR